MSLNEHPHSPKGAFGRDLSPLDGPGVMLPELVGVADLDTGVLGLSCCSERVK